jgi:FkbM family methyltransferase
MIDTPVKYLAALSNGDAPLDGQTVGRGIIHIGANTGQERHRYRDGNLDILWIEAHPAIYKTLVQNLKGFERQRAICQLLTDRDNEATPFHVTSNNSESSSILELGLHLQMHPSIVVSETIILNSLTLDTTLAGTDLSVYDTLLIDVQGAELSVLRGAASTLSVLEYVVVEAADFEVYRGCGRVEQIDCFLGGLGFTRVHCDRFGCVHGDLFVMGYCRS